MDAIKSIFAEMVEDICEPFKPREDGAMKLDRALEKLKRSTGGLGEAVDGLNSSTGKLESSTGKLESSIGKLESSIGNLESSIDNLERSTAFSRRQPESRVFPTVSDLGFSHNMAGMEADLIELERSSVFSGRQPEFRDLGFTRHLDGMQGTLSLVMLERSKGVFRRPPESRAALRASNLEFSRRMEKTLATKFGSNPSNNEGDEKANESDKNISGVASQSNDDASFEDSFEPVTTGLRRRTTKKNEYQLSLVSPFQGLNHRGGGASAGSVTGSELSEAKHSHDTHL